MNAMEGHRLEPENWEEFGKDMHVLLDQCLERMRGARNLPWKKQPDSLKKSMALDDIAEGKSASEVFDRLATEIMPYSSGNTHNCFWGWVHGTGVPAALLLWVLIW